MCALSSLAELPISPDQRRIVVGVDGGDSGAAALEWAIQQARRWSAVIDVVMAWTFPMVEGYAVSHSVDEVEKRARDVVEAAMRHVAQIAPDVVVRGETADGEAGPVLVDAARGADLLVVGSREIGGFERIFRGSVSAYCSRHAPCSVMIVRGGGGAGRPTSVGSGHDRDRNRRELGELETGAAQEHSRKSSRTPRSDHE